jgi:riboflavin biosynthesis pyrimidine reductase
MLTWIKRFFSNTPPGNSTKSITDEVIKAVTPKKVMSKKKMAALTKQQLESMGRDGGIELDRRLTKAKLVDQLHKHLLK